MAKSILDFIGELVVAEMIAESIEKEQETKKPTKRKKEIETPVVSLTDKNILVTFDEDDKDGIREFYEFVDTIPCTTHKNENVFVIEADVEILYLCIYHLTTMYFGIVIC